MPTYCTNLILIELILYKVEGQRSFVYCGWQRWDLKIFLCHFFYFLQRFIIPKVG